MPNEIISQIKLPNNDTYDIVDLNAVTNVAYDSSTHNITKTINGTTSNVLQMPCISGTGQDSLIAGNFTNNTANGKYAFAAGSNAQASGQGSIALAGGKASQLGSVAIGGTVSGTDTTASGIGAIAIGAAAIASGTYAIALGYYPNASGTGSIAIGTETSASANLSLAFGGRGTKASSQYQTAMGKWNIEDDQDTYALILGNGTADDARSNAMTVDWSGNIGANNILASASIDSNGLISFKNSNNTSIFTLQLPLYNGGVS